jgi:hypothetical protein
MLRPRYKNELFTLLSHSEFSVDNFQFKEEPWNDRPASVIAYKETGLRFTVAPQGSMEYYVFSWTAYAPGFPTVRGSHESSPVEFIHIKNEFMRWLGRDVTKYIEDLNEPDLWTAYLGNPIRLDIARINFNEQGAFLQEEIVQIRFALHTLNQLIHDKFNTTEAQQQEVTVRLDYLSNALDRLNRFDWLGTLVNTLITIAIALSLDTERGRQLFELVRGLLKALPTISY